MGISLVGLGSGIDWQTILDQMREAESKRIELLESQKQTLQDRLTAWRDLGTKLTDLKNAADDLRDSWDLNLFSTHVTSSDPSVDADSVFSITVGSNASAGIHEVQINQIAKPQREISESFTTADSDAGKTGYITINGTDITLDGKSLNEIKDEINGLDLGVTASVIQASETDFRLVITANDTGAAGFSFDASNSDMTFTEQAGQDAELVVDGITVTRSSNTIGDVLTGVTIDLYNASPSITFTVRIDHDPSAIQEKVQNLVDAYNAVLDEIGKHITSNTNPDAEVGPLGTDFTLQRIKTNLHSVYLENQLFDIGITINDNNRLEFDTSEFQEAVSNDFSSVADKINSFASDLYWQLYDLMDPIDGTITLKEDSLEDSIDKIDSRISDEQARIDRQIESLRSQFIKMEEALFEMQSQSDWLMAQLGGLAGSSNQQ